MEEPTYFNGDWKDCEKYLKVNTQVGLLLLQLRPAARSALKAVHLHPSLDINRTDLGRTVVCQVSPRLELGLPATGLRICSADSRHECEVLKWEINELNLPGLHS